MDTNSNGEIKRPKRPRIGSTNADGTATDSRFEKVSYGNDSDSFHSAGSSDAPRQQRPYQQRPRYNNYGNDNQHSSYQPRPRYNNYGNNGYGNSYGGNNSYGNGSYGGNSYGSDNQGGYQRPQSGYQRPQSGYQRPRYDRAEGQEGGYRPRYNPNNNRSENTQNGEGGYQPRPRYNNNYNKYNNNNNNNGQGGYQQRPRYNNNNRPNNNGDNRQGGYQQRPGGNRYGKPQGQQKPRPGKSFTPRPKRVFYDEPEVDPNTEIRLNKFIANAGICSRREADEYIQKGEIKVNGQVVTELGTKISPKDVVEYNDKVVTTERKCYVLLNKPKDCVTTADDPNGRLTVMDLVKNACEERIYPVGRLDRNTTGVLLLTNDGDLASKLTPPQYVKKKIYHVWTDKDIEEDDMQRIADGIELEDGPIHADAISYATETDRNQAGIEIHSGRNRIVRRIFESLGYHVTKLDRVYFAGLTKKNLPRGRWRYLTQEEVNFLKMGSFE